MGIKKQPALQTSSVDFFGVVIPSVMMLGNRTIFIGNENLQVEEPN
jgi:hypothetical protein